MQQQNVEALPPLYFVSSISFCKVFFLLVRLLFNVILLLKLKLFFLTKVFFLYFYYFLRDAAEHTDTNKFLFFFLCSTMQFGTEMDILSKSLTIAQEYYSFYCSSIRSLVTAIFFFTVFERDFIIFIEDKSS